jgi:hypothetical protein
MRATCPVNLIFLHLITSIKCSLTCGFVSTWSVFCVVMFSGQWRSVPKLFRSFLSARLTFIAVCAKLGCCWSLLFYFENKLQNESIKGPSQRVPVSWPSPLLCHPSFLVKLILGRDIALFSSRLKLYIYIYIYICIICISQLICLQLVYGEVYLRGPFPALHNLPLTFDIYIPQDIRCRVSIKEFRYYLKCKYLLKSITRIKRPGSSSQISLYIHFLFEVYYFCVSSICGS